MDKVLREQQYFSLDTVAEGAAIHFDESGNLAKWKWYDATDKWPYIVIYYDSTGRFDSFKGTPFISSGLTKSNELFVEMIDPPNVKYEMGYKAFLHDSLITRRAFEPDRWGERGTSSVVIDHQDCPLLANHKYFAYFYFVDEQRTILDSAFVELVP